MNGDDQLPFYYLDKVIIITPGQIRFPLLTLALPKKLLRNGLYPNKYGCFSVLYQRCRGINFLMLICDKVNIIKHVLNNYFRKFHFIAYKRTVNEKLNFQN